MSNSTASVYSISITADDGETPISTDANKTALLLRNTFSKLASGHNAGDYTVKFRKSLVAATGTITCAAVAGADTVTINGTALTATQHNATGTVTAASASVDDTVTVNGIVFTAKAAEDLTARQFNQSGSDTACATSLAACINAASGLSGVITAKSVAAVVTIRAVTAGTAGNSLTLATSNNTRLAKSGTTLASGAAIGNNQFDYTGTNTQTGDCLAAAIAASSTALVSGHVTAVNASGVVTLTAVHKGIAGNAQTLVSSNGTRLAVTGTGRLTGGTETLTTLTY